MSVGELRPLDVAVIGAGPVGLIYSLQLARDGHHVVFLRRSGALRMPQEGRSFAVTDLGTGATFTVAPEFCAAGERPADLVLVAVGASDLASAMPQLVAVPGEPRIIALGQNPLGLRAFPLELRSRVQVGFPGIAATLDADGVRFVRLALDPTMLAPQPSEIEKAFVRALDSKGFPVRGENHAEGWLTYRAVQTVTLALALAEAGGSPTALARDAALLNRYALARQQGLDALRAGGVPGRPLGEVMWANPLLAPLALRRFAHELAEPASGDLVYGVYHRGLGAELPWLISWARALTEVASTPVDGLRALLDAAAS